MRLRSLFYLILFFPIFAFSQNHLLISEIQTSPDNEEFIEIFNPSSFSSNLDSIYLADYNTYYNVVTGTYTTSSTDFLVKFPDGTNIDSGGLIVVAVDGGAFSGTADFEIKGTNPSIPDMVPLYLGNSISGLLSNSEMVMLFLWNGSDLVKDLDYVFWGTTQSNFVDKTGISVDGPDPDNIESTYLNDTPVADQLNFSFNPAPITGKSMERVSVLENGETQQNGNGISGNDETSEPISQNFVLADTPSPGTTSLEVPTGDGSGMVTVEPDSIQTGNSVSLNFSVKGTFRETVTQIRLTLPSTWSWTNQSGDVQLSGAAFSGASISASNNIIDISNAQITTQDSGKIIIDNLTSPSQEEVSTFEFQTATSGGTLTPIATPPQVTVWQPANLTPIADIQANPGAFTTVTIEGIVVMGAGITTTGWTDAYVQDASNAGINVYRASEIDTDLVRGNRVQITGTVDEYNGVTEIIDYTTTVVSTGNPVPDPVVISTDDANDVNLEGYFVEVSGSVTDLYSAGGGTNILMDDGSGECLVRVWDTAGLDLSEVAIGEQLKVRGPIDIYQGATQVVLGYQEDISVVSVQPGDGSGTASVTPNQVSKGQSGVTLEFTIAGSQPYTLESVTLNIPSDWQWSGDFQMSGAGFNSAQSQVQGNQIVLTSATLTSSMSGVITVQNLTASNEDKFSSFAVKTATAGGLLTPISSSPRVTVGQGVNATPIADIQQNTPQYSGQEVTIYGIVVVGAGITATGWTSAYVQDNSGYGLNIYQAGAIDNSLKRGNQVIIIGTVDEFNGVTEIINYTVDVLSQNNDLPAPRSLSTGQATDLSFEGSYIQVSGEITGITSAGGGTNILVDDGSGEALLRIWDTAGLNLANFAAGDTIIARGPLGIYQGAGQILVSYQEDIFKPGSEPTGDGSGFAVLNRDTISPGASDVSITMSLWNTAGDTLGRVNITIPFNWQWTGLKQNLSVSGPGLQNAESKIVQEYGEYRVELSGCSITDQDSGYVTFSQLSAPFDSVYSYFWVKTAVEEGAPQFIANSPFIRVGQNPVYLIRDVQKNSGQFKGTLTLRGIVTIGAGKLRQVSSGGDSLTTAYIQDQSGRGINLFRFGLIDPLLQRANLVEVSGTVTEFNGVTEIEYTSISLVSTNEPLPDPVELSNREVSSPMWEGTLVSTAGIILENYSAGGGTTLEISDGEGGTTVRIWDTANLDITEFTQNKRIFAEGVVGVFISSGDTTYQILPVYQDQLQIDSTYTPGLDQVSLDIPPHPFVPDRGEKIKIRYNASAVNNHATLRIFDLGGRLVTTLFDGTVDLIVNTFEWDGRDPYLDYVPLGTYICHLEVMEPISGKKRTRLAPIVVGTILK